MRVVGKISFPLFQDPELQQSRFLQNMLQTISALALHHNHVDGVAADINCRYSSIGHCSAFLTPSAV
ncbi:MAG: hypothetical protein DMG30_23390, partial [Acidobacteria bacterium]